MGGAFSSGSSSSTSPITSTNKSKRMPPSISEIDRATLDLKNARDKLRKYKAKLESDDARLIERAKKAKAAGDTKAALSLLKVRKMKTKEVESVEQQLLNVLQMVQTLDSKQNEVQVLNAMREGKDALKKLHEETTVDDILNLMDEIQEQHELENEINDVLKHSSVSVEDVADADIEAELEALMMNEDEFKPQQKEQQENLPVAPDMKPLPQVPKTKLQNNTVTTTEKIAVA